MEAIRRKLKLNPRENANIFSILCFWWTIDIFKNGYKKVLEIEDLYQTLTADKSKNVTNRIAKYWIRQNESPKKRPSLLKTIISTFWKELTFLGILVGFNNIILSVSQPYLLGKLLLYFKEDSNMTFQEAMCYAGAIGVINAFTGFLISQIQYFSFQAGLRVRISACSMIYRKSLRLSQTALAKTAFGKVVNLLSNDVNHFEVGIFYLHFLWTAPLMCIVVGYLVFLELRWAGLIGLFVICIFIPLQSYTGKLSSIFRLKTALQSDERIRFMHEIICGVQLIKMYAWENSFAKLISLSRKLELKIIRKNSYVRGFHMVFALFSNRLGIFFTMLSVVLIYGQDQLTAAKVFSITGYFTIVNLIMSQLFIRAIAEIAAILVSVRRLQNFMEYEEKQQEQIKFIKAEINDGYIENETLTELDHSLRDNVVVSMKYATARWIPLSEVTKNSEEKTFSHRNTNIKFDWKPATLVNINIDLKKGNLIGIVGPVGAGKSSLLLALLRELPLESGSISVSGAVSYAAQVPWIFGASVRQNILFGKQMNRNRFDEVLRACDLNTDFKQFADGELTVIGEKGISLSGGQKARVNLARAIYRKADIYLFDDPLSAVDSHVGRQLFNECIGPTGKLATEGATRILVTHQVHFLKDADWIIVLRDGKIETQGSPAELSSSGLDIATLIKSNELDNSRAIEKDGDELMEIKKIMRPEQVQKLEASSKGQVQGSVGLAYIKSGGNYLVMFNVLILFILTQALASGSDFWVSYWITKEEQRQHLTNDANSNNTNIITSSSDFGYEFVPQNIEADKITSLLSTETCIYIYANFIALLFIVSVIRSVVFFKVCIRGSQKLHDLMFKGIVSTTMRFFDTNSSGRILNRFSKDLGAVDEMLPKAIIDAVQMILIMVGTILLTAIVNPLFLIPVLFLGLIFVYILKVVLKTSKSLKRLEGATRSPVFTHIGASLDGLSTIRAFNTQELLIDEFDNHQDLHSACWCLFTITQNAFGLSLDLMCTVFICILMFSFLFSEQIAMGAQVGLAITQIMALTGRLQWGVRQSSEVANFLMAVERILEYRDLIPEKEPLQPQTVPKTWPLMGKIEFQNVVYRYFAEAAPVLRGVTFIVKPKEKIGIVGRTGAGKTSLIGAIFRLAIIDGNVLIDDVDTGSISLRKLRSAVSVIPQDPILFSGTLRRNLDPFEQYTDNDIWQALKEVELKDFITYNLSGLETYIMAGGSNLSVGQRQLLCLARAILRNNKILVLDEATANVDPNTDNLIQQTIRTKFTECTVLTVAHRLNTIMDSDRVVVMDAGVAVELGTPFELMHITKGIFREMVETLGVHETDRLTKIAEEKFQSNIILNGVHI